MIACGVDSVLPTWHGEGGYFLKSVFDISLQKFLGFTIRTEEQNKEIYFSPKLCFMKNLKKNSNF